MGNDFLNKDLPYVIINMAMSADGKIATENREVHSFGSRYDIENLYKLRATADAVMCGARTVESEGVILGVGGERYRKLRLRHGLRECHLRIIVSGSLSISPELPIFKSKISPIIILTTESVNGKRANLFSHTGANIVRCGFDKIDFIKALKILKDQWGVKTLLCEGGGSLNSALFNIGVVKELYLTICPLIFGGKSAPTIADGDGIASLKNAVKLSLISKKRVCEELFLRYRVIG